MKNIIKSVNMRGKSKDNGDKWTMEKIKSWLHTITIPPSKTHTTGANSHSLQISIIENDPAAGVLQERTICDDMSWVITEGTSLIWTVMGNVAKVATQRTEVVKAMVLEVTQGLLTAVGAFIIWEVDT